MQAFLVMLSFACASALPHYYGVMIKPMLDSKSVEGRYLYKPSMYDGMKNVLMHYGMDEEGIKAMGDMDLFLTVSCDEEAGTVTFEYNVGETVDSITFTPGEEFESTNPMNGKTGMYTATILSPNSLLLTVKGEDDVENVVFSLNGMGGTVARSIYPKMGWPITAVQMMQKVDEEGKPVAMPALGMYHSYYWGKK
jgi:hypothetical protein